MKNKNIGIQATPNVNQVRTKPSTKTKKSGTCTGCCCPDCPDNKQN
ncbi:MAG: hypothetical protein PSN36_04590 [Gammaproteobacteria bacterium]|nr:hypothetical protein [Gammaproteobacteria bacterium]